MEGQDFFNEETDKETVQANQTTQTGRNCKILL